MPVEGVGGGPGSLPRAWGEGSPLSGLHVLTSILQGGS